MSAVIRRIEKLERAIAPAQMYFMEESHEASLGSICQPASSLPRCCRGT